MICHRNVYMHNWTIRISIQIVVPKSSSETTILFLLLVISSMKYAIHISLPAFLSLPSVSHVPSCPLPPIHSPSAPLVCMPSPLSLMCAHPFTHPVLSLPFLHFSPFPLVFGLFFHCLCHSLTPPPHTCPIYLNQQTYLSLLYSKSGVTWTF